MRIVLDNWQPYYIIYLLKKTCQEIPIDLKKEKEMNKIDKINLPLATDSYKLTHHRMYPEETEKVFSYFEAREGAEFPDTIFFGLQYILKKYLVGKVVTKEDIDTAEQVALKHFGQNYFDRERWDYILEEHDGRLPVEIKAVPEGLKVPVSNVMMTIVNTDPKCYWLTNHLETILSQIWYPCTVATGSNAVREFLKSALERTSDNMDSLNFMLHDFGYRGVSSVESARIGGAAHLINFLGTDTIAALEFIQQYYSTPGKEEEVRGFSVAASEHSVMTSLGRVREHTVVENIFKQYPEGIVSIVSDSYNVYDFVENISKQYMHIILNRDGKTVFRPDSGEPIEVLKQLLSILDAKFGSTINSKGYRVLNPKVGLIWGDGIDIHDIKAIINYFEEAGWAADNFVFGMGGGLLQRVNRDTQKFAFKCSAQKRRGVWWEIYKQPIHGNKSSKQGRLILTYDNEEGFVTQTQDDATLSPEVTRTVFKNGSLIIDMDFDEVRENMRFTCGGDSK